MLSIAVLQIAAAILTDFSKVKSRLLMRYSTARPKAATVLNMISVNSTKATLRAPTTTVTLSETKFTLAKTITSNRTTSRTTSAA